MFIPTPLIVMWLVGLALIFIIVALGINEEN